MGIVTLLLSQLTSRQFRVSVTISQPLITLTTRALRSRPPRLPQAEQHGCLERGACSLRETRMTEHVAFSSLAPPPPPPPPPLA